MLYYAGIDVGKKGAVAVLSFKDRLAHPKIELILRFSQSTDPEISSFFRVWRNKFNGCALENVNSSPQMGVASSFTFGRGRGYLEGCLQTAEIQFDPVTPNTWETALKCRSGGKKSVTRAKAQSYFGKQFPLTEPVPMKQITDEIADALLIALYCSKKERGLL